MRKEIFFAIVAGGALGLVIAFGVWRASSSAKTRQKTTTTNSTLSPQSSTNIELKIVLSKPENMAVFTDTPVTISGVTTPKSWVVVSGEDADTIVNSNESGAFETDINLEGGANQIKATAFGEDGSQVNTDLLLIYSSQFTPPSESAKSQAYIGTVTDLSNSVIQIKDETGDIQQISATSDAVYVDTRGNTTKTIKGSDVAIGDYLIAMGVKGENNILSSSRILVTDSLTKTTRTAFFGTVTDDSGYNKFVMKNDKTNETMTVTPGTGIDITGHDTFGEIVNGDKLIVVGELKDGTIDARTINIIK